MAYIKPRFADLIQFLHVNMRKVVLICALFLIAQQYARADGDQIPELQLHLKYQRGYNPFRLFGNIPVPDDKDRRPFINEGHKSIKQETSGNCMCKDVTAADDIHVRIKVGSFLRFNLIKVFGYILHRKQIEFNTAYYTSLYFILTCIKLNHVDVLSLVQVLEDIAFSKPNEQYIKLFEAMETHLPKYLTCAATFWKEGIKTNVIDMDRILIPYNDDTLVVNLLDGITPEELEKASRDKELGGEPKDDDEQRVVYNFNINILRLIRFEKNKKDAKLSEWLLAGLLSFFPRTLIQPDLEESIQLVVQHLYEVDSVEIQKASIPNDKKEPYEIVKFLFQKLLENNSTVDIIKDAVQTIIRNLKPRSSTAVNQHYTSFTYFVQPDHINIKEMLNYVLYGSYPSEIRIAAGRVQYYLDYNLIGYHTLMLNFNPYLYSSPTEVLIAVLDRILRRQPYLTKEVLDSVGAVYSYLIFKYRYTSMPVVFPSDMINMNVLLLGLKAPDIDERIRNALDSLIIMLQKQPLQYSKILVENVPVHKCTTPVICLLELFAQIKATKVPIADEEMSKHITVLATCECKEGHCPINTNPAPNQLIPDNILIQIINVRIQILNESSEEPTTPTYIIPTQSPPITPTEGPIPTISTSEGTSPTTPTVPTVIASTTPENALINIQKNLTVNRNLTDEEQIVLELRTLLKSEEYNAIIREGFITEQFLIAMYITHLKMKNQKFTKENFKIYLNMYISAKKQVENYQELQFSNPMPIELIVALPTPTNNEEKKLFETLKVVLGRQDVFELIVEHIKKNEETTVAVFLKAVLEMLSKANDKLSEEELKAVTFYIDKVQVHGFGEAKIKYGVKVNSFQASVDISGNMDNAIGFDALDKNKKELFNSIVNYIKNNGNSLSNWMSWAFYPQSGSFTNAMFQKLLTLTSLPSDIKNAITILTPLINYDKDGEKPSFDYQLVFSSKS